MNEDFDEGLTQEKILELFFEMGGSLDKINTAIDDRLFKNRTRKITTFEMFIKSRIETNPKVLKMAKMEIDFVEAIYLSQYPALKDLEILDLRQNPILDSGLIALCNSEVLKNIKELDIRNCTITRDGLVALSESETLSQLEKLDARMNRLGKRWEEKLMGLPNLPNLKEVKVL
ncbi:MAG: hypothetical protein G3M70_16465 [Candidatus Nitronauta litoralis]|uniref:Leucine-rich repeat domain-containing protein n=1 Tax=Candidatus Nitronauta litoralis TaxID=2705533 RepID=A0A7T0BYP5_9BACT|nr:MAG: hypothetical protein G3M70_16465 [Candidatus Nitronauta litoralis]